MKVRLYWKILLGFWFTFMLINAGSWILWLLYWEPKHSHEQWAANELAPGQLAAAKIALELGGLDAVARWRASLPPKGSQSLSIQPQSANATLVPPYVNATDPDGTAWLISYSLPQESRRGWSALDLFYVPSEMLIVAVIGGLLFSAGLAWHLTKPVHRMRHGFERLASGDLATRLQPVMGRRQDEIADLAKDFDRMAERLQQLVTSRDQLLHDVSHELRSPLARLSQTVALMHQDRAHVGASLERIDTEVRRLDELVGELLSLARAESGDASRDRYFDLSGLIEAVVSSSGYEAEARGVRIDAGRITADECIVRGSAELMRRALENVVRNAVQMSAPGQVIEVAVVNDDARRTFIVTVADEGPGVKAETLQLMFEPFVRLGESAGRGGYGLGLAIARRAMVALGGSIEASNRSERGLLVTMRIPMHEASVAS